MAPGRVKGTLSLTDRNSLADRGTLSLQTYPEFQRSPIVKNVPTSRIDYHNIRSDRAAIHFKFTEEKGKIVVRPKVYSDAKVSSGLE